jgi:hypothetical protein
MVRRDIGPRGGKSLECFAWQEEVGCTALMKSNKAMIESNLSDFHTPAQVETSSKKECREKDAISMIGCQGILMAGHNGIKPSLHDGHPVQR